MKLVRIPYEPEAWRLAVEGHPEAEVYHSPEWLGFLRAAHGAEPLVAQVVDGDATVGHFVGGLTRRYGLRLLGSPLSGWGTQVMGFLLDESVERRLAAEALIPFAFHDLRCVHVELGDRQVTAAEAAGPKYVAESSTTSVVDIAAPDEELLSRMNASTRNYARRGSRRGLQAELDSSVGFADEYMDQLRDVFAVQGLVPTYGVERVRLLIEHLQPSGQLMLMRIRDPEGRSVATAIVVGGKRRAILWGQAFYRSAASHHPVEFMHWQVLRYWRELGLTEYDLGGAAFSKAKYGGRTEPSVRLHASRVRALEAGRAMVRRAFRLRQRLDGLRSGRTSADPVVPGQKAES